MSLWAADHAGTWLHLLSTESLTCVRPGDPNLQQNDATLQRWSEFGEGMQAGKGSQK
jgi:hypothetical protein